MLHQFHAVIAPHLGHDAAWASGYRPRLHTANDRMVQLWLELEETNEWPVCLRLTWLATLRVCVLAGKRRYRRVCTVRGE